MKLRTGILHHDRPLPDPGVILVRKQPKNKVFYAREGSVTVALSWIVMSIMGSIPFLLSGSITNPVDALFETVSGFTTTGASILPAVEPLQHGILFWRSFTHWIGWYWEFSCSFSACFRLPEAAII